MNRTLRQGLVAASAILALAALPALAGPGKDGHGRGGGHGLGRLLPSASYLDLTAEQQASMDRLRDEAKAKVKPLIENQRSLRRQMRDLLDAAKPDPTAVGNAAIQLHQSRQAVKAALKETEQSFVALLNADQKAKYDNFRELRSERHERRGDRGRGDRGGMDAGEDDEDGRR